MSYGDLESTMNSIRNEFSDLLPRDLWPRKLISRGEISLFLFGNWDASLREIMAELLIPGSYDMRDSSGGRLSQPMYGIDAFSGTLHYRFKSIGDFLKRSFVYSRNVPIIEETIRERYVFWCENENGESRPVVLSKTPRFFGEPKFTHKFCLARFREFLNSIGYPVTHKTGLVQLERILGFDAGTSLKTMMESFGALYVKRGSRFHDTTTVYVQIVCADEVSEPISMREAAERIGVHVETVRDYIGREVVFKHRNRTRKDTFLIYAED